MCKIKEEKKMKRKIVGIFVCTLLIVSILPSIESSKKAITENNAENIYFVKNEYNSGYPIVVETDKSIYDFYATSGEEVYMKITNIGGSTVAGHAGFTVYDDLDNYIWSGPMIFLWTELEPGESYCWSWNQQKSSIQFQVPSGRYRVNGGIGGYDDDTFINISRPPNTPMTPSGPNSGKPDSIYSYYSSTTDSDFDKIYYMFDWDDGMTTGWLGPYDSGEMISSTHSWSEGSYNISVKAKDEYGQESEWSQELQVNIMNSKPNKPTLTGPTSGKINIEYTYISISVDPDGNQVYYYFDWYDGTNSSWLGPYDSGEECLALHSWSENGSYEIRVKTKDIYEAETEWTNLTVRMPKNKAVNPFMQFLEQHTHLFSLLRLLLGL